jgi:hypothetical protein
MQPAAAEVEAEAMAVDDRPGTATEPVARFDQKALHAGVVQTPGGGDAGGAATDDYDFEFTARHNGSSARKRASWQARGGLVD